VVARHRTRLHNRKGPTCSICKHEHRVLIESTRIAGASLDNISAKYGVSRDAVHRHMKHVPEDVRLQYIADIPVKELAQRAATEGVSLLDYFAIVRGILLQQFQLAASVNDKNGVAILAGRLTEVLRAIGSATGEILKSPAVQNVTNNTINVHAPFFSDLEQMLVKRLAGSEDLPVVVEGLLELDSRWEARTKTAPMIEHREGAHEAA
jgi:hypothetical protein